MKFYKITGSSKTAGYNAYNMLYAFKHKYTPVEQLEDGIHLMVFERCSNKAVEFINCNKRGDKFQPQSALWFLTPQDYFWFVETRSFTLANNGRKNKQYLYELKDVIAKFPEYFI